MLHSVLQPLPCLCGICEENKNIVFLSFIHFQWLLSWLAKSLQWWWAVLGLGFFSFGSLHRSLSTYLKLSRIIWYAFGCFGFHFPFALPECTKDFFSLASTQAVDSGCIWTTQHSAEASQPSTMAMSMAGCHELMLTWHCTRASFACLMRPSLRLQAERQQAVMFTLLEQCRCAVTWANLNYVPGYLRNPQCVLHS